MTKLLPPLVQEKWLTIRKNTRAALQVRRQQIGAWFQANWFRLLLTGILFFLLLKKDVSLQLSLLNGPSIQAGYNFQRSVGPVEEKPEPAGIQAVHSPSFRETSHAGKKAYVERFAAVAQSEMKKFGIPASVKLAQGLLETSAGSSALATRFNNHFGIKCFQKNCSRGHCSNFSDDSHKDFFMIYETAWESFRNHSLFLKGDRYRHLFKQGTKDYKAWAHGLENAGYATDDQYAEKLIALIEDLKLYRYDR